MSLFESVIVFLGALLIGAMSPGPSFVFVARTSVAGSRMQGLAAALGMGVGAVIFAAVVMLGLQAFLVGVPWLYFILKIIGGLYLIYIAVGIVRGAKSPLMDSGAGSMAKTTSWKAFRRGLLTQLSNPKTAVAYGSILAALLPHNIPFFLAIMLPALVFLVEAGWYSIVALVLSSAAPRKTYLTWKAAIDRLAGGVLALLGIKLIASANPVH